MSTHRLPGSLLRQNPSLIAGLGLLVLSVLLVAAGALVPFFGPPIASLGPDAFLLGIALVAYAGLRRTGMRVALAVPAALVLTLALAINTRMPSILSDLRQGQHHQVAVANRLSAAVGQPLHVETNIQEIQVRMYPYASVTPACYGDGCFIVRGFRGSRAYWRENVMDVVLATGFSKASEGEKAPTMTVLETQDGDFRLLELSLVDAGGAVLSKSTGRYRNGYPLESKDASDRNDISWPGGLLQFLMHGNSVARWSSKWARPAVEPPLGEFLKVASLLSSPQGQKADAAKPVDIQILAEKVYEPTWIVKGDRDGTSGWTTLVVGNNGFDCGRLLRPEQNTGWAQFVGDPTGRKKVRYPANSLCRPDAVWFLEYASEPGKMVLVKYRSSGDFAYRVSFDKPKPLYGFAGHIMPATFEAKAGYLEFEWWDTIQSGYDRHIKRSMKVRVAEPSS